MKPSLCEPFDRWFVLTGAGVSAESGVPTFRSGGSALWSRYRIEELATPEGFAANPLLVWQWYVWRRELIRRAEPNPGHLALARIEEFASDFLLATQNVDGLHQRAGSRRIEELHGNIFLNRCSRCTWEGEIDESTLPPLCPECGSLVRPGVVWFGEPLPEAALRAAERAARSCRVCLVVGTSALVEPAASLPRIAKARGALLLEVNPEETPLSPLADRTYRLPAAQALPELVETLATKGRLDL